MGFKAEDLDSYKTEDDLRHWCDINQIMIRAKAQNAWDMYGENKQVSLENATLTSVSINTQKQDSFLHFSVQGDKITALTFDIETDSSGSRQVVFTPTADGRLRYDGGIYVVEFPMTYEGNYFSLEIEMVNPVTAENFDELKKRLIAKVSERTKDGKEIYADFSYWEEYINKLDYETDFRSKINNKDDNAVHYWESKDPIYITYKSYGKDLGLKYSDFGWSRTSGQNATGSDIVDANIFAGGYEVKKIDKSDLKGKMTFKGKALATALYQHEDGSLDERTENTKLYEGTANLVFDNGKEELTTDFSYNGWYKVEVNTNEENSSQYDITFTGGNKIEGSGYKDFKITDDASYTQQNILGYTNTDGEKRYGTVGIGYYGDSKTPSEATGYVSYGEEKSNAAAGSDSLHIQIGFGTTIQK